MTLYQGRIGIKHSGLMDAINRSLPVDIRLLPYDLLTNRAWATELQRIGVLSEIEFGDIAKALGEIAQMAAAGAFDPLPDDEDVHTLVERLLTEKTGEAGSKIHTGRSRNDQVVCDLRMWAADQLIGISADLTALIRAIKTLAETHAEVLLAGNTHLQPAQPITLGHFLLSLAFALLRDKHRLDDVYKRVNLCPLGSGALAGSGFEVDRKKLAQDLGFDGICDNTLDAVSDRDFAQEIAAHCAILCGHLSRYAEQFIIWANPNFGYLRFADEWSTGSSMMPQKRNPDAMELIRAKAARCIGHCAALLALTKGLPPSYSKDLQEDKASLFDAVFMTRLCVRVFREALQSARFFPEQMAKELTGEMLATDLADELVKTGLSFRKAHERVAHFVSWLEKRSLSILDLKEEEMAEHFPEINHREFSLGFQDAITRRNVAGGTAFESVKKQVETLERLISDSGISDRPLRIPDDMK